MIDLRAFALDALDQWRGHYARARRPMTRKITLRAIAYWCVTADRLQR